MNYTYETRQITTESKTLPNRTTGDYVRLRETTANVKDERRVVDEGNERKKATCGCGRNRDVEIFVIL